MKCQIIEQTLALKKLKILKMVDAQARRDCIGEIDLAPKALNHPNVIKYYLSFGEVTNLFSNWMMPAILIA